MSATQAGGLRPPFLGSWSILRVRDCLLRRMPSSPANPLQVSSLDELSCWELFLAPLQVSGWWPPSCGSRYGQCKRSDFLMSLFWRQLSAAPSKVRLTYGYTFSCPSPVGSQFSCSTAQVENWRVTALIQTQLHLRAQKKKKKRKKKKKKEKKRKDKMWQGVKLEIPCASNTHNLDFKSR